MRINVIIGSVLLALAGGLLLLANLPNSYESKQDLRDAYTKAGGKCLESDGYSNEKATGYFCEGGNWLSIYSDQGYFARMAQAYAPTCEDPANCDRGAIKGDNWLIVTSSPQFFANKLGGELLFSKD